MMSDQSIKLIFKRFTQMLKTRIEADASFLDLSQEAILSFFLGKAIIDLRNDYFTKLYIEYPVSTKQGSRDKIDLFVSAKPKCYFEIKYVRPIPSGAARPLPQHRGKLIND